MSLTEAETYFLKSWFLAEWELGRAKAETPQAVAQRLSELCVWKAQHYLHAICRGVDDLDKLDDILSPYVKGRNGRAAPPQTRRRTTLIYEIRKVLFNCASYVARDMNAQSILTMRLPAEVLSAVFGFLSFPDCISASHVCHDWRDVALSEPWLWSDVELSVPHLTWSSAAVPDLLARSKAVPLRLTIKGLCSDDVPHVGLWLSPAVLERTSYLALRFDAPSDLHHLWDALQSPAPLLETLVLRPMNMDDTCEYTFHIPQTIFLGCAPRLEKLDVADVRLAPGCAALSSVTTLIADFVGMHTSDGELAEPAWLLLGELPALCSVELTDVWENDSLPSMAGIEHVDLHTRDDDALATVLPTIRHADVRHITVYTQQPHLRLREMCITLTLWTRISICSAEWPCRPLKERSALSLKAWHCSPHDGFTRTTVFDEFSSGLADLVNARLASDEIVLDVSESVLTAHGFRLLSMLSSVRRLYIVADDNAQGAIFDATAADGRVELPDLLGVAISVPAECAHRTPDDISAFFYRNFIAPQLQDFNIMRGIYAEDCAAVPPSYAL